jgi:hypothetical protein
MRVSEIGQELLMSSVVGFRNIAPRISKCIMSITRKIGLRKPFSVCLGLAEVLFSRFLQTLQLIENQFVFKLFVFNFELIHLLTQPLDVVVLLIQNQHHLFFVPIFGPELVVESLYSSIRL